MSSRMPPRCIWVFVIYCFWLRQDLTVAMLGLRRWSKRRMASSPKPAAKMSPATQSEVRDVMQEPERAGMSR